MPERHDRAQETRRWFLECGCRPERVPQSLGQAEGRYRFFLQGNGGRSRLVFSLEDKGFPDWAGFDVVAAVCDGAIGLELGCVGPTALVATGTG